MINRQTVTGYLGKDPEVDTKGTGVCTKLSIGWSEHWNDKKGVRQERTEWFTFEFWDTERWKPSETFAKWGKKGSFVIAEGTTLTRSYDDKNGVKQYFRFVRGTSADIYNLEKREKQSTGRDDDGPPANSGSTDDIPF